MYTTYFTYYLSNMFNQVIVFFTTVSFRGGVYLDVSIEITSKRY